MKEIVITIDTETLELKVEAEGYRGIGCTTDIEEVLRILNARTINRKSKPERVQTSQVAKARQ